MTNNKAEELFKRIKRCRENLKNPENREAIATALEEAAEIMRSDEFGDFLSLSTVYRELL